VKDARSIPLSSKHGRAQSHEVLVLHYHRKMGARLRAAPEELRRIAGARKKSLIWL
jgi:hypothetical protein